MTDKEALIRLLKLFSRHENNPYEYPKKNGPCLLFSFVEDVSIGDKDKELEDYLLTNYEID